MLWFSKNYIYPIGVDMGDNCIKLIQLGNNNEKDVTLIAGGSENCPEDIEPGSINWQRWVIEAIEKITANNKFRGGNVIAAIPANEVFIDHIKVPKTEDDKLQDVVFSKIKQKLPAKLDETMIKYIPTENDNVMVIATEREKIDRHLAIYEKAQLTIKSIGVWPIALTNSYTRFFGRRKTDIEAIVMLLDIETNFTNIVICRHKNPLFARSIPMGAKQIDTDEMITRLVLELNACRRQFSSMHRKAQIERLIFLSGSPYGVIGDKDKYRIIATQLEMPAQMGDCLAAVKIDNPYNVGIDRRECQFSWATAFGLSLSQEQVEKCKT
ncbi:MAG: type II secretion system protein GspL [Planctomycetota bacterium]|jgi:Tfp pilus assembly PilM family ATPase